ncbi:MAG: hypothetical protein Q4E75_06780, partial [bacterium]|nr:hypothetical protein [bacterium]
MKKIVKFIVEKKYLILFLFIMAAIICSILTSKVNINYDISKYLPNNSNVRKGLDIMNSEFETKSTSFNMMFEDLSIKKIDDIYNKLKKYDNVSSVSKRTKGKYTLYKIEINGNVESKIANDTYKKIVKDYKKYNVVKEGELASRNTKVITPFILFIAVSFGTIILIIMCDSIVEVFLFLFTILIAVLLNKGTNIIFSSVSSI